MLSTVSDVVLNAFTRHRLAASLKACLWAVLVLCLGNAWGSLTRDPLDQPRAQPPDTVQVRIEAEVQQVLDSDLGKSQILSETAEGRSAYFGALRYDRQMGVWSGRDPKLQLYTPYGYVANAPLVGMDPSGQLIPLLLLEPAVQMGIVSIGALLANPAFVDGWAQGAKFGESGQSIRGKAAGSPGGLRVSRGQGN